MYIYTLFWHDLSFRSNPLLYAWITWVFGRSAPQWMDIDYCKHRQWKQVSWEKIGISIRTHCSPWLWMRSFKILCNWNNISRYFQKPKIFRKSIPYIALLGFANSPWVCFRNPPRSARPCWSWQRFGSNLQIMSWHSEVGSLQGFHHHPTTTDERLAYHCFFEKRHIFLIGNTCSDVWFSIVMWVFRGVFERINGYTDGIFNNEGCTSQNWHWHCNDSIPNAWIQGRSPNDASQIRICWGMMLWFSL